MEGQQKLARRPAEKRCAVVAAPGGAHTAVSVIFTACFIIMLEFVFESAPYLTTRRQGTSVLYSCVPPSALLTRASAGSETLLE